MGAGHGEKWLCAILERAHILFPSLHERIWWWCVVLSISFQWIVELYSQSSGSVRASGCLKKAQFTINFIAYYLSVYLLLVFICVDWNKSSWCCGCDLILFSTFGAVVDEMKKSENLRKSYQNVINFGWFMDTIYVQIFDSCCLLMLITHRHKFSGLGASFCIFFRLSCLSWLNLCF